MLHSTQSDTATKEIKCAINNIEYRINPGNGVVEYLHFSERSWLMLEHSIRGFPDIYNKLSKAYSKATEGDQMVFNRIVDEKNYPIGYKAVPRSSNSRSTTLYTQLSDFDNEGIREGYLFRTKDIIYDHQNRIKLLNNCSVILGVVNNKNNPSHGLIAVKYDHQNHLWKIIDPILLPSNPIRLPTFVTKAYSDKRLFLRQKRAYIARKQAEQKAMQNHPGAGPSRQAVRR